MASFDDPLNAFATTGQKVKAGDSAFLHLYRLDKSLKGHEVLIASSNNKAVENVSKELPLLKAVGRDFKYFRTVADRLLAKKAEDGSLIEGEPTWGLAAAVLGNAFNCNAFQQALWWDSDRSLRLYLKAAKGDSVVRDVTDETGKVIRREVPTVIEDECPPTTSEEAKLKWKKARNTFKSLHSEVEVVPRKLEEIRKTCQRLAPCRRALADALSAKERASANRKSRADEVSASLRIYEVAKDATQTSASLEQRAFSERPGWLFRLFNTQRHKLWREAYEPLVASKAQAEQQMAYAAAAHDDVQRSFHQAEAAVRSAAEKVSSCELTLASFERQVEQHRQLLGARLVDEKFFEQNHECWNLASPWLPDAAHQKREDLFAAALDLHRAFIDVSAQKILHNIGVLMGAMHVGAFQDDAKKALLGDLWSTLFLAVPVVSTTFASMDRMLGDLPPSSIGWVLVDEAGQATPQSAVGALMRAKKAIIVGDPLQIPPVTTLPERLVLEVAKYFGVSTMDWLAPEASVQTVADEASRLQAEFRANVGVRKVGLPLLVHRRCQEPMFGISNRIAYDGQMVPAAGKVAPGAIALTLGQSAWLNVDGTANTKWCAAEGEIVVQLLKQLAREGVKQPDVYVITPFRIVAQELRCRLGTEHELFQHFEVDPQQWLKDRVGTIHTFQGKEAEAVIAVLGAPMASQQGARRWACATPNIINVMVSRAKQSLYVVGSRAAWSSVGHGKSVAAFLPTRQSSLLSS